MLTTAHLFVLIIPIFGEGIVRMANINPLIQITKHLTSLSAPENTVIHYCVYHSQFPLLQRSHIENVLDKALSRHDRDEWLTDSGIPEIINQHPQKQHIFVVLATSVAEVGRDHDYDWAVVEPSSIRSIIQLAGRIQRHRKQEPENENIHILSQNYKGLKGLSPCFEKPGFESEKLKYASKKLDELIKADELAEINAIARIKTPEITLTCDTPPRFKSFNGLEHVAQKLRLEGSPNESNHASQWWQQEASWCGEIQRLQPFRYSPIPNEDYRLTFTRTKKTKWQKKQPKTYPPEYQNTSDITDKPEQIPLSENVTWWVQFDLQKDVNQLMEKLDRSEELVMKKFTHVSLKQLSKDSDLQWQHHTVMGIYQILKKDKYSD